MQNIVEKKTEVIICEDLVLINYLTCKLVDNYPAVNKMASVIEFFP